MTIQFVPARLDAMHVFSEEEAVLLTAHAQQHPLNQLLANPRWKEESAIDFAYTSAQIEGNTYSRADTITLLKMGRTAGGKTFGEAQMILNLREAYDMILERAQEIVSNPLGGIRGLHKLLMHGLLPEESLGATRKTKGVMIGGSDYVPPDGVRFLEQQAVRIFENTKTIPDPFSASLYAACNLSYLQFFEDGNKRTSRVFQNAVLIAAGLPPVQFPASMAGQYIECQLNYYEHGDYGLHRGFVVEAYTSAYPVAHDAPGELPDVAGIDVVPGGVKF
jgi:Fic family protein